ncbi:hypothetical protein C8Q70DRAFT_1032963 [Cubamyces menziesii]|nr:hypothetical protein C8Q70DRAFT_1032963 [Cubamyces menziesii]
MLMLSLQLLVYLLLLAMCSCPLVCSLDCSLLAPAPASCALSLALSVLSPALPPPLLALRSLQSFCLPILDRSLSPPSALLCAVLQASRHVLSPAPFLANSLTQGHIYGSAMRHSLRRRRKKR